MAANGETEAKKLKSAQGAVKEAVKVLASGCELQPAAASNAMRELMAGEATPAQTGAFLALLSLDRCQAGVVHALADVMRANAVPVELPREGNMVIDIVGTGGDGQDTFNISTAAALTVAGAGARVVKHGNRAASSKSGAADVLEAMGARIELGPVDVSNVFAASGFSFVFARSFHPAMRHVGPIRQELGVRTVFNILGPLTNPAKPDGIVCGVFSPVLGQLFVDVFKMLGMQRALVVHGCEGLDELSIAGPSMVWELKADGSTCHYEVQPSDFGLEQRPLTEIAGGTPLENAAEMAELFTGKGRSGVRDAVALNAGAGLYIAGKALDFKTGAALALAAMGDGRAAKAAQAYVAASKGS
mmetsp:Transcript_72758/g.168650  ORF Transcript_72758/g.168650 Transcript_72758/m.168650 type:complete len:359 (+) Transcript_72758:95-1171(+)